MPLEPATRFRSCACRSLDVLRWAPTWLTTRIRRTSRPLTVPVTAIYSKRDGVVAWRACIDRWSPNVRHIEVSETHVGLGFSPRVLGLIAAELERR
jgi:hypothetical protein